MTPFFKAMLCYVVILVALSRLVRYLMEDGTDATIKAKADGYAQGWRAHEPTVE